MTRDERVIADESVTQSEPLRDALRAESGRAIRARTWPIKLAWCAPRWWGTYRG